MYTHLHFASTFMTFISRWYKDKHIIYNNWMCEATACSESTLSNTCHRIRNRD